MNRKDFIFSSTLAALSVTLTGAALKSDESTDQCTTTNDILGPFYRAGAPLRSDLSSHQAGGTSITVKGVVYGSDCITQIKSALVEIWHANQKGAYDNDSDEFRNRASWKTNAKGEYSFKTILPGKYLNGKLYRPAHIHFRVSAESHTELISQLYFSGDPHIKTDPWASDAKAIHRIHPLIPEGTDGSLTITFNIYLD